MTSSRTPLWKAPLLAFYSKPFYREVASTWRGRAFLYLLLILAVCWIPAAVKMIGEARELGGATTAELIDQIPEIRIRSGVVEADCEAPCLIANEKGETVAIIDTSGEVDSLRGTSAMLLLTQNSLIARKNKTETRTYDLSQVNNFTVDRASCAEWARLLATLIPIVGIPLLLIGSYAWRTIQVLVLGAIGLAIAAMTKTPIRFPALTAIACVALTPMMVVKTIVQAFGGEIPLGWLLSSLVTIGVVLYGLTAAKGPEPAQNQ